MSNKSHIEKLISTKIRRLEILKEQQALKGPNTPPEIIIEIELLETEIEQLQAQRQQAQSVTVVSNNSPSPAATKNKRPSPKQSKSLHWEKIGAIAGVLSVIIALMAFIASPDLRQFIFSSATPTPKSSSFSYQVRVQAKNTRKGIPNANVILEVGGKAPLDGITDSTGLVRILVSAEYAGRPGRLIVEANGYSRFKQEIDITEGALPKDILLEPTP